MNSYFKRTSDLLVLLAFSLLFALSIACTEPNPATGKKELVLISSAEEVSIGKSLHAEMTTKYNFNVADEKSNRVKGIGSRVASVCDRQDIEYHFNVTSDADMNALAAPGGFVYATAGLVQYSNDDELACVLAHECGHIAAKHSIKHLQAGMLAEMLLVLVDKNSKREDVKLASVLGLNLLLLGYSRKHEYEADLLGVRYAWRAGYNPDGMATFFTKLQKANQNSGSMPEFLSTHPDLGKRIENVRSVIKKEMMTPDGKLKKYEGTPVKQPVEVNRPS